MAAGPPLELTLRDRLVLRDLARVRLLTGRQLERLHLAHLTTPNARGSARRRSLGRLDRAGYVNTLPRRVGGERAGSAGLIYTLDAHALRDRARWEDRAADAEKGTAGRVRRPWSIGWLFVSHTLDVAELYVQLIEAERRGDMRLLRFDAEPASWHTTTNGTLKPDAFVIVESGGWERHWWIEVDRATESLPTIRRKLQTYLDAYQAGDHGPADVLPRLLLTAPDHRRAEALRAVGNRLPDLPPDFIQVVRFDAAAEALQANRPRPPP